MPIRSNPNSDNFIDYKSKKASKSVLCITCRQWVKILIHGVCEICDRDFKAVAAANKPSKTIKALRIPKGIQ